MKKIFFILTIFLTTFGNYSAQTEKLDQFFNSFENKSGVTSIDIKKPMFDLLDRIDISDEYVGKIKPIMRDVNGLKLLVFSKITFPDHLKSENQGQIKMNEAKSDRVSRLLSDLNLNELMSVKNDDVSMKFLAENAKDGILENLIFNVDSKDEIAVFILNGKMKMDDVNKIINSDNISASYGKNNFKSSFTSSTNSYLSDEERNVGQFSGIHASKGVVVNYKQENPVSIKVVTDADKLQYVITKVEDGILKVYVDNKGKKNLKFKAISVNVSAPKISEIKTSSGAIFNGVSSINENNVTIDASSGSVINAGFNIANNANIELSSGAVINSEINSKATFIKGSSGAAANLSGKTNNGTIDMSSGAVCNGADLKFNSLKAEATSGAIVSGYAVDELNATASSAGMIKYKGNPKVESNISKTTGGNLSKIN